MTDEIRALLAQMAKELDNYLQRTACDPKVVHPLLCVGAGESGRDPITEVFMATDDQSNPPPVRASKRDWERVTNNQAWSPALCLLELRDRVAALEVAAKSAAAPAGKRNPQWLGGVAVPSGNGWIVTQLQSCAAAPAGVVAVEELAYILSEAPSGDLGMAYWLLKHRRIGPLLRGEGAAAPKRVVLPERPPLPEHPTPGLTGGIYLNGYVDGWAAARAEVERQQGGQADG